MLGRNVITSLRLRGIDERKNLGFQRSAHVTDRLIARLGLETELEGHNGCVNCLEWNERGNLLVSGSDDIHVIIWDALAHKKLSVIHTGHQGNIFTVKFLPGSNEGILVTGAADCRVRVHDVEFKETLRICSCHEGRVKRIATTYSQPHLYWTAAEDGLVLQFDHRVPHTCSQTQASILVNLSQHMGRQAEAKCLAINHLRPYMLAVGANDPYIRLYDRRMITLALAKLPVEASGSSTSRTSGSVLMWDRLMASPADSISDNLNKLGAQYLVAGHLPSKQQDYRKRYRSLAATYVTFSPGGDELLVNLGGEQIYLFDVIRDRRPAKSIQLSTTNGYKNGTMSNGYKNGSTSSADKLKCKRSHEQLPAKVEQLKLQANIVFEEQKYTLAIAMYNEAVQLCPNSAILFGNRAAAYMKRSWDGDTYAALRDCHQALKYDPHHLKAHFRLARCLFELHWTKEASDCLNTFKVTFPEQADSRACCALDKDINDTLAADRNCIMPPSSTNSQGHITNTEDGDANGTGSHSAMSFGLGNGRRRSSNLLSDNEKHWRSNAYDYERRFCGHCNTTTDIKEANFFGSNGQYIVAGSDDGSFFIWDHKTTNIVRVLHGDDSIVNCLQPHPSSCLLATSGIDPVIRLWSPRPEDGTKEEREIANQDDAATANQKRMNADPIEVMLHNMGYRLHTPIDPGSTSGDEGGSGSGGEGSGPPEMQCRTS